MKINDLKYYFLIAVAFVSLTVQASSQSPRSVVFIPTPKDFGKPLTAAEVGMVNVIAPKQKGILACATEKKCRVMNMPLLWQSDPLIDAGFEPEKGVGCYDTSIVSVIIAAMANRNPAIPKVSLNWRLQKFMNIQPGIGGNGKPAPKAVKQLSYEYSVVKARGNAAAAAAAKNQAPVFKVPEEQPIYFHEVIWALNGGKINENCNPSIYSDCDTSDVSNKYGHAFYRNLTPNDNITNEYIIEKMKAGYVMMIGFSRYRPLVEVDNGVKKVTFVGAGGDFANPGPSPHKVVFIGFDEGSKFPLLINDVGNGQQYYVRLSSDLSTRTFSVRGNGPPSFGRKQITYPTPVKIYIEYKGLGEGINRPVFFLEQIDGLRIVNANEKLPSGIKPPGKN